MKNLSPLALALLALGFSGCGLKPLPHPRWVRQPTSALVEVPYPPPPARVEFVPKQPSSSAVWVDGEWTWNGRRWGWRVGRWLVPPPDPATPLRLPAAFSPWVSVRSFDGTLYVAEGTWRDSRGIDVPEPPPLAVATANETESSNPDAGLGGGAR